MLSQLGHVSRFWSGGCGAASPPIEEVGQTVVLEAAFDGEQGVGARLRPVPAEAVYPDGRRRAGRLDRRRDRRPGGEAPTEWRLLTTLDVRTAKDAAEVVGYYLQRWRIEDFFRVLKSGCRTEFLLFRTADRLQRAVAVNAVIAWRIMVTALLGRQVPDCEPEMMFTGHELDFLASYADEHGLSAPDRLQGRPKACPPGGRKCFRDA